MLAGGGDALKLGKTVGTPPDNAMLVSWGCTNARKTVGTQPLVIDNRMPARGWCTKISVGILPWLLKKGSLVPIYTFFFVYCLIQMKHPMACSTSVHVWEIKKYFVHPSTLINNYTTHNHNYSWKTRPLVLLSKQWACIPIINPWLARRTGHAPWG